MAHLQRATFEIMHRDPTRAAPSAAVLAGLSRDHEMPHIGDYGYYSEAWAAWTVGDRKANMAKIREGLALRRRNRVIIQTPLIEANLAEAEAEAGEIDAALATLDAALADTQRNGQRCFDAELHRTRGEVLLKQDSANPLPAEDAFLTAIAVAQHQKARSFELRGALALAKLYSATSREADAHAALGPALEGFSPTVEFPEIAEARALFEALAQTDGVKNASASKKQRVRLHVSYGNALLAARGLGAPETTAAFKRARKLATGGENAEQRFLVNFGLWVGSNLRGELSVMRELASEMLRDCASRPNSSEAGAAHRVNGTTHWYAGEFVEAREQLDKALALFDPERDRDLKFRYFADIGVTAMAVSAHVYWALGEVEQARGFIDGMVTRSDQAKHVGTTTIAHIYHAEFEILRRDPTRAAPSAVVVARLGRDHEMPQFAEFGYYSEAWAAWTVGDRKANMAKMREGVALHRANRIVVRTPLYQANLAEAEAAAGEIDAALATLDAGLAETQSNGQRCFDAELHRTRGEILLKQSPANLTSAEEAFLTAIAIAQTQKARSFELRAALALAKLYRAIGRDADARAALGPALEGFAPTPEFPEIAEAQALLAAPERAVSG
jgi:predicted ATPase